MKIKKYYAKDLQEGMRMVKRDLGKDAVIIESRSVRRKGWRGYLRPKQLEILAALDRYSSPANANRHSPPPLQPAAGREELAEEVMELKSMVKRLILEKEGDSVDHQGETLSRWQKHLESHDINPELIKEIIDEIRLNISGEVNLTKDIMSMVMEKKLQQRLKYSEEKSMRRQVFIGPTGVGKTTTLAKLAARHSIYHNERVGIITIDHYRIGAVEQLRTYSDIVDVPLEVAMHPSEIAAALKRLEHCDRVLVDTAGRSTGNKMQIKELTGYIRELVPAEVFLVVSATTRWRDIEYIANSFRKLLYNRLIVTKIDETGSLGAVFNAVYSTGSSLVYLTNGQNVPDDIKTAREANVPTMLAGVEP